MKIDVPFNTCRLTPLQEISVTTVHETLRLSISFPVDSQLLRMRAGFVYTETVVALVLVIKVKERTTFTDRAGRKLVSLYFAYRLTECLLFDVMIEKRCSFQR
jgi:hypothetical protein